MNITERPTYQFKNIEQPVKVTFEERDTDLRKHGGFGTSNQYILSTTVSCAYWATDAEKPYAMKAALRVLTHGLFDDVYHYLAMIRREIYSHERINAMKLIDRLEAKLDGYLDDTPRDI